MANPRGATEAAAERRQRALELRIAGASYRQIAAQLKISLGQAYNDVDDSLKELAILQNRKAERLRDIELARLERLTVALQNKVRVGDTPAIRTMVSIMDRRAKLMGLDLPTKHDLHHTGAISTTINHHYDTEPAKP
jgi:hypothetical protein